MIAKFGNGTVRRGEVVEEPAREGARPTGKLKFCHHPSLDFPKFYLMPKSRGGSVLRGPGVMAHRELTRPSATRFVRLGLFERNQSEALVVQPPMIPVRPEDFFQYWAHYSGALLNVTPDLFDLLGSCSSA